MSGRVLIGFDCFAKYATGLATGLRSAGWEPMLLRRDHDIEFGGEPGAQAAYIAEQLGGERRDRGRARGGCGAWRRSPTCAGLRRRSASSRRTWCTCRPRSATTRACRSSPALRPGRYAYTCHDAFVHPGDDRLSISQRYVEDAMVGGRRSGLRALRGARRRAAPPPPRARTGGRAARMAPTSLRARSPATRGRCSSSGGFPSTRASTCCSTRCGSCGRRCPTPA